MQWFSALISLCFWDDISIQRPIEQLNVFEITCSQQEKKNEAKTGGGPPPQDCTPTEELALSNNQGSSLMEGVGGGVSSDPGDTGSPQQGQFIQGMFEWVNVKIVGC